MNTPTPYRFAVLAALAYLACIVAANYVTARYGFVPVGFGYLAVAGTYFAGASFVARDAVQDTGGRWIVLAVIVVGAALSWLVSSPALAVASGVTFLVSESADMAVWSPLRARGYLRAAIASNVVGAVVDSLLFLTLAGFPVAQAAPGQIIGKLAVTGLAVAVVVAARGARRAVAA